MNEISYPSNHKSDDCDKCLKTVGKKNLTPLGFLYLDKNDKIHPDITEKLVKQRFDLMMKESKGDIMLARLYSEKLRETMDWGYRQYFICKICKEEEEKE